MCPKGISMKVKVEGQQKGALCMGNREDIVNLTFYLKGDQCQYNV